MKFNLAFMAHYYCIINMMIYMLCLQKCIVVVSNWSEPHSRMDTDEDFFIINNTFLINK